MSAPLREAARLLYGLRRREGWDGLEPVLMDLAADDLADLIGCWQLWARDEQLRPADADGWVFIGGRGTGKTRAGAEDTLDVQEDWGPAYRGLLVSKSYQRDIEGVMVFGESGLMACAERRGYKLEYIRSKNMLRYPHGGHSLLISADSPEAFRGPQFNHVWADEIAKWNKAHYVWQNIMLSLRLKTQGDPVRRTVTTTPKRASPIIHHLFRDKSLVATTGRMRDNIENLDPDAVAQMESTMRGTMFGAQELDGVFHEGSGTMVSRETIQAGRVTQAPPLVRKVVSFDPAILDRDDTDDHGIVVGGVDGDDPSIGYVLADRTVQATEPEVAAMHVVKLALDFDADIVVEINQGGKWVTSLLQIAMTELGRQLERSVAIKILPVWATQAKEVRAEPVGALYELMRVRHVGHFPDLETEVTTWIPGMPSPNRMDALVHLFTHLLLADQPATLTKYG